MEVTFESRGTIATRTLVWLRVARARSARGKLEVGRASFSKSVTRATQFLSPGVQFYSDITGQNPSEIKKSVPLACITDADFKPLTFRESAVCRKCVENASSFKKAP